MWVRYSALAVVACIVGCGGDDASDAITCSVTCAPNEFALSGTIDGQAVDVRRDLSSYTFQQDGLTVNGREEDGKLVVSWPDNGRVEVVFHQLVARGATVPATVSVQLPGELANVYGNCADGDDVSLYRASTDSAPDVFEARSLTTSPFCSGAKVTGTLCGCAFND